MGSLGGGVGVLVLAPIMGRQIAPGKPTKEQESMSTGTRNVGVKIESATPCKIRGSFTAFLSENPASHSIQAIRWSFFHDYIDLSSIAYH